jgi:hypothetical protein
MPLSLGRNLCVNSAERQPRSALSLGEPRSTEPTERKRHRPIFAIFRSERRKVVLGKADGPGTSFRPDCAGIGCLPSHPRFGAHWGAASSQIDQSRRFPICPYCQEISFELAHSDQAFWRGRSAPGTQYRRHRRSARSQSSNKAVVARSRAIVRGVRSARRSAILAAIVIAVRGLLAFRG